MRFVDAGPAPLPPAFPSGSAFPVVYISVLLRSRLPLLSFLVAHLVIPKPLSIVEVNHGERFPIPWFCGKARKSDFA